MSERLRIVWHDRCGCAEEMCEFDEDCTSPRTIYLKYDDTENQIITEDLAEARATIERLRKAGDELRDQVSGHAVIRSRACASCDHALATWEKERGQ